MVEMRQMRTLAPSDLSLLAYAQRMAETSRSAAAKHMFEVYVKQERQRLESLASARSGGAGSTLKHTEEGAKPMKSASQAGLEKKPVQNGAILFTYSAKPDAKKVFLVGDFNGWAPDALPMSKRAGAFVKRVHLEPGEHQYKFVVDGEWQTDPAAERQVPNKLGSMNSVVSV